MEIKIYTLVYELLFSDAYGYELIKTHIPVFSELCC